jgi:hypothetical protein
MEAHPPMSKAHREAPSAPKKDLVYQEYVQEAPVTREVNGQDVHYIPSDVAIKRHNRLRRVQEVLENEFFIGPWYKTEDREWTLGCQSSKEEYENVEEIFKNQGGKVLNEFHAATYAFPDGGTQFIFFTQDIVERAGQYEL